MIDKLSSLKLSTKQWVVLGITVPTSMFLLYLLLKKQDEEENYRPSKDLARGPQLTIEMTVPFDKVGAVIGQQGVTIKKIQEETSCRIKFQNEVGLEDKEDRHLVVRGKPESALIAEQLIRKIITEPSAIQTFEMMIPQWAIGKIIGRNGENIRSLCRASKARINIERDDNRRDPTALRQCVIKGTVDQIQYAKGLIEEEIALEEAYRHKLENASANRKQRGSKMSKVAGTSDEDERFSEYPEAATNELTKDQSSPKYQTMQVPDQQEFFSVYMSAVEHVGHFWVQVLGERAGSLDLLVQSMTEYYSQPVNLQACKPDTLCTGDIIASPFQDDESWYRARIIGFLEDGEVDLYYVDFGDSDKMPRDSLCSLRSDFLSLPHQAVECCLAGVQPVESEWSDVAVDLFEDLTYCAKWKPLMAKIVTYHRVEGGTTTCVDLVDTNGTQDVNIANVLVERGYAKFTHQKSSTRNTTRERSYPPPPQSDNGPAHLPVETLTVPLEMGELMLDDDIEEFVDEGTRTG
ncbi:tudor and KH domain-containing protein-like [Asterias amurensis]|uniref:tudor and KH domain-containing protein-like n=1 Tax=Asterias amurensis TaxID=7602 RepID=UPI003AB7B53F